MSTETANRRPVAIATCVLVAANFLLFSVQFISNRCFDSHEWWYNHLLVPKQIVGAFEQSSPGQLLYAAGSILVTTFLHGSLLSVAGNMLFLWLIRDVEKRVGWKVFLSAYLLTGLAGIVPMILNKPNSETPCVGAGASVAGILGIFFVMMFSGDVLQKEKRWFKGMLAVFLMYWLGEHVYGMYLAATGVPQDIAHWAVAGGFAAGILLSIVVVLTLRLGKDHVTAPKTS